MMYAHSLVGSWGPMLLPLPWAAFRLFSDHILSYHPASTSPPSETESEKGKGKGKEDRDSVYSEYTIEGWPGPHPITRGGGAVNTFYQDNRRKARALALAEEVKEGEGEGEGYNGSGGSGGSDGCKVPRKGGYAAIADMPILHPKDGLWTPWHVLFAEMSGMQCVYANLPGNKSFVVNARTRGENYEVSQGPDSVAVQGMDLAPQTYVHGKVKDRLENWPKSGPKSGPLYRSVVELSTFSTAAQEVSSLAFSASYIPPLSRLAEWQWGLEGQNRRGGSLKSLKSLKSLEALQLLQDDSKADTHTRAFGLGGNDKNDLFVVCETEEGRRHAKHLCAYVRSSHSAGKSKSRIPGSIYLHCWHTLSYH